jgi:3-deoxy-D-manno-octulosonate 8-phosphate phosphatase KdsC-like HAD superfamily phosphatase
MLALVVSPEAIYDRTGVSGQTLSTLATIRNQGTPVYVITNRGVSDGVEYQLKQNGIEYIQASGRQGGQPIRDISQALGIQAHDVMVLAVNVIDMQMAKTGGAILIAAAWSTDRRVVELGMKVDSVDQLREVIDVIKGWTGNWWYSGNGPSYEVRALVDLSSKYVSDDQAIFARKVTNTAKNGGARLVALLAVTCRSMMIDNVLTGKLFWGCYPSSSSDNDDTEVLSDFVQRLRTSASNVHFAKRGQPLFIRHCNSVRRSTSFGGDRTDPGNQIETLHLNPEYRSQLKGRNVLVVDDCTTYGVSFAVAAAFLYAAGASHVVGIALGKFGNRLNHTTIEISSDPFNVVRRDDYRVVSVENFDGRTNVDAQSVLQAIIS